MVVDQRNVAHLDLVAARVREEVPHLNEVDAGGRRLPKQQCLGDRLSDHSRGIPIVERQIRIEERSKPRANRVLRAGDGGKAEPIDVTREAEFTRGRKVDLQRRRDQSDVAMVIGRQLVGHGQGVRADDRSEAANFDEVVAACRGGPEQPRRQAGPAVVVESDGALAVPAVQNQDRIPQRPKRRVDNVGRAGRGRELKPVDVAV